jgi:TolA-binding protein
MKKSIAFCSFCIALFLMSFHIHIAHSKNLSEEDQLILVGIGAFNDGFYNIAEKQFSLFLTDYPNHRKIYDVYYLLGKTFLIKKKIKEARTAFSKIISGSKNFEQIDYALFWMAGIEMNLGNGEEARKLLALIIEKFPRFEWIDYSYYLLGLLDFGSNRPTLAESSFKKASLLSKNNHLTRFSLFWLGILSCKQNDYEAATRYFQKVWDDTKSLPQGYLKKYALFWLGEVHLKLGKFNDAKLNYRTFYEQFNTDPLVSVAFWRLGFCEYQLGNTNDSIEIFQSFKNQFKDSPLVFPAHYYLGKNFLISGDYTSSIKELNLILNKSPGPLWGVSLLELFWNYIHLGETAGANRTIQRLQKLNHFEDERVFIQWLNGEIFFAEGKIADSLPYYFNIINTRFRERSLFQIGKGYFFENKFREAITNFDILSLEFPNSRYIEESLLMKGGSQIQLGNLDQAAEAYDLIIKKNGNNHWRLFALTHLGSIYSFRNEDEKAESSLKKVINDFPNHSLFYYAAFQLGNLFFRKRNIPEAVHYYSMVLSIRPDHGKGNHLELLGEACFGLGEIFYQNGKYDKAFTSFKAALPYLKENSLFFFLTQLEIGNLQRKWGKYSEAKKSYTIILDHSKDEEIRRAAEELFNRMDSN